MPKVKVVKKHPKEIIKPVQAPTPSQPLQLNKKSSLNATIPRKPKVNYKLLIAKA
jgi:hypothetical protein